MSAKEAQQLKGMISDFLVKKNDLFNTYYIQLLAWHINDIKIMKGGKSILEYAPSPLLPISATNKIFTLFSPKRIDTEKVSTALLLNYLNNYAVASSRFKNVLRRYLKSVRYSKEIDIYFVGVDEVVSFIFKRTTNHQNATFQERLKHLGIRQITTDTKYFKDALQGRENDI